MSQKKAAATPKKKVAPKKEPPTPKKAVKAVETRITIAKPFVKWAGGKAALVGTLRSILPPKIQTYYEPFVGGGALFFALAAAGRFQRAVLNDFNSELMDAFKAIRDFPDAVVKALVRLKEEYTADPQATYSCERSRNPQDLSPLDRAVRFLFLNRTGFNGLYRVNKKGEFNVPFGKYTNPRIADSANIKACAEVLSRFVVLSNQDFSSCLGGARPGDVVYFDPPYVPASPTANFTSYTAGGFGLAEQRRLAQTFRELAEQGVAVVASNSDTDVVRDLYEGYEMHCVDARRNINRDGDKRGPVRELIIVGRRG
jgi:DNA adenine methylase